MNEEGTTIEGPDLKLETVLTRKEIARILGLNRNGRHR